MIYTTTKFVHITTTLLLYSTQVEGFCAFIAYFVLMLHLLRICLRHLIYVTSFAPLFNRISEILRFTSRYLILCYSFCAFI